MAASNSELAKVSQTDLTPDMWSMYKEQAKYIAQSGLVAGAEKPEQAIVVMLLGLDLGLRPTAALRGIDIIKGRPAIKPQLMAALIVNAGHPRVRVIERSEKQCVLEFRHKDDDAVVTVSYTWAEAQRAGLAGKDNYAKNPADMLYNRCLGRGARQEYPEIFFNLYGPDELGNIETVESTARPPDTEPVELRPEISERLDRAADISQETGIDTITDTFGTWAAITKNQCEQGLRTLIKAADLATAAKMVGLEGFRDTVKANYPDAVSVERAYSAILHLVHQRRQEARERADAANPNQPDPARSKAAEVFEDAVVTVVPAPGSGSGEAEEDQDF
jgi:hypothetical protein